MKNRRLALLGLLVTLAGWLFAQNPVPQPVMLSHPVEVRPLAPQMTQRFLSVRASLQPPAESWVEQQARVESQRPAPNLDALRTQIRSRFASSLISSKSARGQLSGAVSQPAGADIEAMVFVVLMQATTDMDQDLQQIMNETKALTAAKQSLRDTMNQVNQAVSSSAGAAAQQPCNTPACRGLSAKLGDLAAVTAQTRHPVRLTVASNPTYGQLRQVSAQMNGESDSLNDISQQEQMQLQMLMDKRSQFEQMLSNLMKSTADTSSAIVSNLK